MDNEMIERVAKAILETPNASDYKTLVAINAIKAMREPTEKMKFAGSNATVLSNIDTMTDAVGAGVAWNAMIDAIIGDK
jgi:hypothetical protein